MGLGRGALFTPKDLYGSEIRDGKHFFCNGHTVRILLFRRGGVLFMVGAVGVGEGWGGVRGWVGVGGGIGMFRGIALSLNRSSFRLILNVVLLL